jgi:hypothetical protein
VTGLREARSGLDFKQFSLGHITRVLQSHDFANLVIFRFFGMLWSPVPFGRG